jgi:hypothetical protein
MEPLFALAWCRTLWDGTSVFLADFQLGGEQDRREARSEPVPGQFIRAFS